MPRWFIPLLLLLASLALLPVALIARSRVVRSPLPRVHLVPDMDNQGRYQAQQANGWFADSRAMRLPVAGTVARGELNADPAYHAGIVDEAYVTEFPVELTAELLTRGQRQYAVFCAPCHGLGGYGDGVVAQRADRLQQGTWVAPSSFHAEPTYSRPPGHLFNTITNGIRTMPAYGPQVEVADRWAIVGYIKALQRSQRAGLDDVPPDQRQSLR